MFFFLFLLASWSLFLFSLSSIQLLFLFFYFSDNIFFIAFLCVLCDVFVKNMREKHHQNMNTIKFCGLLPEYQLAACQPHSLKRERWGLLRYGLKSGRVERGLKESERGWV